MIKILDEMNYFGFGADSLKMPFLVEELGINFLRKYSKWKWYMSRIEINTHDPQPQDPNTAMKPPLMSVKNKIDSFSSNLPRMNMRAGSSHNTGRSRISRVSKSDNLRKGIFFKKMGQLQGGNQSIAS
jgi:hypothetical protein